MAREISTLVPWFDDRKAVLTYVLSLVADGTLSIDVEGRIWRHYVLRRNGRTAIPTKRAENKTRKGYLAVTLHRSRSNVKVTRGVLAHVLVWVASNGPIPVGLQVNHKDCDKTNNALSNLELVTGAENIRHSYANGRERPFSLRRTQPNATWRPGKPLITERQKQRVRELRQLGHTYAQIVAETGISQTHVARILRGGSR